MRASIITPALNAASFIEGCISNVAAQGHAVLEHLIVDGGSQDGTVAQVEALIPHHPHLRLIGGPERGQSDALNKGTERSQGEVIGILNADDFYQPGVVARALALLDRVGAPDMVVANCLVRDAEDRPLQWNRPADLHIDTLLRGWRHAEVPQNPSAYFYRRHVHDLVGGYDVEDHYAMDLDFVLSCAARVSMLYVSEHWGNFRLIPGAKSVSDSKGAERRDAVYARHAARRGR